MQPGPTLIHIKVRAGSLVCPRKALSIDPIDAAEPSEPSHDQYGKPVSIVTVARNSRMSSTEGYCRSNNQREPKSAAVSSMRQEKPHSLSYQPTTCARPAFTTAVCVASKMQEAGL